MDGRILKMWSVNWRTLLDHPSEIVRLDEQLRLKTEDLLDFKNKIDYNCKYLCDEVDKHMAIIHNFRCYLYIEGTKYFQTQLLCKNQLDLLKRMSNELQPNERREVEVVTFSNLTDNQLNLFLLIETDMKNTEDIFKKVVFRFLAENNFATCFHDKMIMANVIMSKCYFSIV